MRRSAALLFAVMLPLGANAAGVRAPAPAPVQSGLEGDRAVVTSIVNDAVSELKLCSLALDKSKDRDVRSLCRRSITDSARAAIEGMQIAQRIGAGGAKLEPAARTPAQIDSLAQLNGADFDRAFLLNQIEESENDEHTIRYALEVVAEASVKRYESVLLPIIMNRLSLAEGALESVSVP